MKKFFNIFLISFLVVSLTGCVSNNDSDYTVDRKRDFDDIFQTDFMIGAGGKAQVGIINLAAGILSTHFTNRKIEISSTLGSLGLMSIEKYSYDKINWARNKNYTSFNLGLSYAQPTNQSALNYYSEFGAGFGTPVGGFYLGFNPGELLDWSLGYFGIDIYDDDIGLPPTFEEDLLALNKFFLKNNGNLSLTDKEQTVICHEYENARVYEFENYSLAVFPLYWQKYGVYDFMVFIDDAIPKCERLTSFGAGNPKYNPNNPIFKTKYRIGFLDKFLGNELPKTENKGRHRSYDDGSINNNYTDIDHKNGEDTYIKNKLAVIRLYGNFNAPGIKKVELVNSDINSLINNDKTYIIGELQSKKSIKITLPINHKLNKTK
ncbi:hypothetical protein AAEX28_15080 [Lentisphaerota bacterium WC36G]|nr:hypothetical protein LJT99_01835 [Lentisphaerae bacterium WC36]